MKKGRKKGVCIGPQPPQKKDADGVGGQASWRAIVHSEGGGNIETPKKLCGGRIIRGRKEGVSRGDF